MRSATDVRANLIMMAVSYLLMGDAKAVLPPDEIDAAKSSASHQLIVQLEAVELLDRSTTGGLDMGRATGRIIEIKLSPGNASTPRLGTGDVVSFRVPIWAWEERRLEPPGPGRLYWGPDAPRGQLEVWGSFRADDFIVSVFEASDSVELHDMNGSVNQALERIDQIATTFVAARNADLSSDFESVTGLHLEPADSEGEAFRANSPASDGWALSANYRRTREARILVVSLGGPICVRRADVTARHGSNARPVPLSPERRLPGTWYLRYARPWGAIAFGFRMTRSHDYDDCLVEVAFSDEG